MSVNDRGEHPFEDRWSRETCWDLEDLFNLTAARATPDNFMEGLTAVAMIGAERDPRLAGLFAEFVARKAAVALLAGQA